MSPGNLGIFRLIFDFFCSRKHRLNMVVHRFHSHSTILIKMQIFANYSSTKCGIIAFAFEFDNCEFISYENTTLSFNNTAKKCYSL